MESAPWKVTTRKLGSWQVMPPAEGACMTCAAEHDPAAPHDPQSLYWATLRALYGAAAPTWTEALAHCTPMLRDAWRRSLATHGIAVGEPFDARGESSPWPSPSTPPESWTP